MSNSVKQPTVPRATVHKQILDTATVNPTASVDELAGEVTGANPALVERVLDEYGDPAGKESETTSETSDQPMAKKDTSSDIDNSLSEFDEIDSSIQFDLDFSSGKQNGFTERQYETLYTIYQYPNKSQRELAEVLGISGATVNNHVNAIEGFDWADREEFVEELFDQRKPSIDIEPMSSQQLESKNSTDQLTERVQSLENQVETLVEDDDTASVLDDPELVHKVIHACMESEAVTKEEELLILKDVLQ